MERESRMTNQISGDSLPMDKLELPDDFSHYKYYRYITPEDDPDIGIRVLIDKNDMEFRAETINPETGEVQNSTARLCDIDEGINVRDSTEEEFNRLNAERAAWVRVQKLYGPEQP